MKCKALSLIFLLTPIHFAFLAEPQKEVADVYLNFEDATLESVVNYLAEQKKINIIPNKELKARKVSLTTREPLTVSRAWDVLHTLLEMNDFTLINVDNVYRIVKNKDNQKEPLPFYSSQQGTMPKDLPDSDQVVRYVYVLNNISTDAAGKILSDLLGGQKIRTVKELSTCIIIDKCHNIKSAMQIIEELDKGGLRESIKIIRLKNTNAKDIADLFSRQIFEKEGADQPLRFIDPQQKQEITYFSSTTKIIPEERQNALILLGQNDNIDRIIEFIAKYIDVPMDKAASRVRIKELKYVEATTVKQVLEKIIQPPQGQQKGPLVGEFKYFEDVTIDAEKADSGDGKDKVSKGSGNRLIISCSNDDWARLEKIIDKLDKPKPQVALEVIVVDIDNNTDRELGAQIRQKTGQSLAHGLQIYASNLGDTPVTKTPTPAHFESNLVSLAEGDQGTTAVSIGKPGDVWAVIRGFLSTTNTNIISQPFLVTSNNESCSYSTSEKRKLDGKLVYRDGKGYLEKEDVRATTQLTITPRINTNGLVDLQLKITLQEFLAAATVGQPPRSNRVLETRACMATGEVLVLGGLTKDKDEVTSYKTPILGDIPILGNLFKNKLKIKNITNLYIFIRPSIIKPKFEGGPDEYTTLKLDYAKYQIFNAETLQHSKDPIERWYFKPDKQSIDQKMNDLKKGVYRPIDEYAKGKTQPRAVRIERDPYYRASEEIAKVKTKEKEEEKKKETFEQQKLTLNKEALPSLRKRINTIQSS